MNCTKKKYLTKAHAELTLEKLKRELSQKAGAGSDQKFLEAYLCRECGCWHHGRKWKSSRARYKAENAKPKLAPKPKPPSWGYLKKRAEKIGLHLERDFQKRIAAVNALMQSEQDIERLQAEHLEEIRRVEAMLWPRR